MVMKVTGIIEEQLAPEQEQVVGTEVQEPRVIDSVLPRIEQPEKREPPPPAMPRAPLPPPEVRAEEEARQIIYGDPVLKLNRYSGGSQEWQELLRWDIPVGKSGDLHEISLLSDNDAKTRFRIVLGHIDQNIPTDRQTSTPFNVPFQRGVIPGGTSCYVEVRSTDGTSINVDGMMSATER